MLRMITQLLMVHTQVLEAYIHLTLMYTTDNIFSELTIKDLINEDGNLATPFKLTTGMIISISNLRVLFCPCVIQRATVHVGTKAWNMRHQSQKGFQGILVDISQHQKRLSCLCTTQTEDRIFVRCCFWWHFFYCVVIQFTTICRSYGYTTRCVTHTLCYIFKGVNGNIITFAQFEEENLISETHNNMEISQ